jgi:cytochrome c oxidase subunit 3
MTNNVNITDLKKDFQPYPYHMVNLSPWPLLTSFAVLCLMVGAVFYFNGIEHGGISLLTGFAATTRAFALWFRDITTEGTYLGDHTLQVQKGLSMGVALFIVTEIFFFVTIFWAFFSLSCLYYVTI